MANFLESALERHRGEIFGRGSLPETTVYERVDARKVRVAELPERCAILTRALDEGVLAVW